ncbi:hypothetical protein [Kribbella capetownensis]|nr:hypothetical protein [Kribbella capetownensis]
MDRALDPVELRETTTRLRRSSRVAEKAIASLPTQVTITRA